jgi:hypothetical protein
MHCVTSMVCLLLYKSGPRGSLWFPYSLATVLHSSMTGIVHVHRGQMWIYIYTHTHTHTERDAGPYLQWSLKLSTLEGNTNVLKIFHTTLQYQIYWASNIHSMLVSSCYMHTDGQMDRRHSDFNSHSTRTQTCLKTVWQIRSHARKWKHFEDTGILCATNFNLKYFLFYANTEPSKTSLRCKYHI